MFGKLLNFWAATTTKT